MLFFVTLFLDTAVLDLLLEGKQFFLDLRKTDIDGFNLALLEIAADILILDVVLETAHIVLLNILFGVLTITGNAGWFKHPHQIGKRLGTTVMRSGTGEYQTVTMVCKELGQLATQSAIVGYSVTFIDDDNVPMGLFQPGTELTVILQSIDRDNSFVIEVERIFVHGYLCTNTVNTNTIKAHQGNGKAVPNLFLELCQNALQGTNEDSTATTTTNHLTEEDTHLNGLTKAHAICNQQTRTR